MKTLEKETMEQLDSAAISGTPTDIHAARSKALAFIQRLDAMLEEQAREEERLREKLNQEKLERRDRAKQLLVEAQQAIAEGAAAEGITTDQFMDEIDFHPTITPGIAPEPVQEAAEPVEASTPDPEPTTEAKKEKKPAKPVVFDFAKRGEKDPLAAGLMLEVLASEKGLTDCESWNAFKKVLCAEWSKILGKPVERLGCKVAEGLHKKWPWKWTAVDLRGHGIEEDDPRHATMLGQPITARDLHTRTRRRLSQANFVLIRPEKGKKTKRLRVKDNVTVVGV